jgi:hypothetical protein
MPEPTITLTWDLAGLTAVSSAQPATLLIQPTAQLTDPADELLIGAAPEPVGFTGTGQLAGLIPTDRAGITPAGWGYQITIVAADGSGEVLYGPVQGLLPSTLAAGGVIDLTQLQPMPTA